MRKEDKLEIYIAGTPEEIAALVAATQERRNQDTEPEKEK